MTWQGSTPKLAVWAPTAKDVDLLVRAGGCHVPTRVSRCVAIADGVWSVTGAAGWNGASYLFEVDVDVAAEGAVVTNTVTDPYSLLLTTDSARSVIVDLDDPSLPTGRLGARSQKPNLAQPEDSTIYELHVRELLDR